MELTTCPECGVPAEVTWRFELESTDGSVEHIQVHCANRHSFLGPADSLLPTRDARKCFGDPVGHQAERPSGCRRRDGRFQPR